MDDSLAHERKITIRGKERKKEKAASDRAPKMAPRHSLARHLWCVTWVGGSRGFARTLESPPSAEARRRQASHFGTLTWRRRRRLIWRPRT